MLESRPSPFASSPHEGFKSSKTEQAKKLSKDDQEILDDLGVTPADLQQMDEDEIAFFAGEHARRILEGMKEGRGIMSKAEKQTETMGRTGNAKARTPEQEKTQAEAAATEAARQHLLAIKDRLSRSGSEEGELVFGEGDIDDMLGGFEETKN